jgi:hypothetical protein
MGNSYLNLFTPTLPHDVEIFNIFLIVKKTRAKSLKTNENTAIQLNEGVNFETFNNYNVNSTFLFRCIFAITNIYL